MTAEDKVRELAEQMWNLGQHDDIVGPMNEMRKLLTTFALDQQRVGAEGMREIAADTISHYPFGRNDEMAKAIRALEPIPAPGKKRLLDTVSGHMSALTLVWNKWIELDCDKVLFTQWLSKQREPTGKRPAPRDRGKRE